MKYGNSVFSRIEVRTGATSGLLRAQSAVTCLAAVMLLVAGRDATWTFGFLLALLLGWYAVNRETRRLHPRGRIVIHADGTVQATDRHGNRRGVLAEPTWVSRWLCVFAWRDGRGTSRPALVMARRNHPDDFRRLRVLLRLGAGRAG